jgi:hypothetical protein
MEHQLPVLFLLLPTSVADAALSAPFHLPPPPSTPHTLDQTLDQTLGQTLGQTQNQTLEGPTVLLTVRDALRYNSQQIVSPYDVYATLRHLTEPGRGGGVEDPLDPFGKSLMKPLPRGRGCREAGVPPQRCQCPAGP